jgi:hypothetical protein
MILFQRIIWRVGWRLKYEYDTKFAKSEREIDVTQLELVGKDWREVADNLLTINVNGKDTTTGY